MSPKPHIAILAVAALALLSANPHARAQPTTPIAAPGQSALPHVRRRIEITPRPLLYRRCIDWYELQHRPGGTVLYPQMRCWWVRG